MAIDTKHISDLITEFRALQSKDAVSPESLGYLLQRIVDVLAKATDSNLQLWMEADIGDTELPLNEGKDFSIDLDVTTSVDPADYCGIRLVDSLDNRWEFPFLFHMDDRSENLCALYYDYAKLWKVEYIAPTLFFYNITHKKITADDLYIKATTSISDLAGLLRHAGSNSVEVLFNGSCKIPLSQFEGIMLADQTPSYFKIPFTTFNEDASQATCGNFVLGSMQFRVEIKYGADDGMLIFTRFA